MASLSTCHLGLWLGWQILLNLVKHHLRLLRWTPCRSLDYWMGDGDTPKLATSGVMVNIRKSSHHHHIHYIHRSRSRSRSGDITRYPCCIVMLLVLFNKIRVHSYHTVLRWFLVSISPFDNYPIFNCCVWVTPLRFTAKVYRVGLQQLGLAPAVDRG